MTRGDAHVARVECVLLARADGCGLCPPCSHSHRKVFPFEQHVYTRRDLDVHAASGSPELGLPPHPSCPFCRGLAPFYSTEDLVKHKQHTHSQCALCAVDGGEDPYHRNHDAYKAHAARAHFPCFAPGCDGAIVFRTSLELQVCVFVGVCYGEDGEGVFFVPVSGNFCVDCTVPPDILCDAVEALLNPHSSLELPSLPLAFLPLTRRATRRRSTWTRPACPDQSATAACRSCLISEWQAAGQAAEGRGGAGEAPGAAHARDPSPPSRLSSGTPWG